MIETDTSKFKNIDNKVIINQISKAAKELMIETDNENHVSRGRLLKRRSTRHISEITAITTEFGNSAKVIVPRSWLRKRVVAFLHSEYTSKMLRSELQMSSEPLLSNIVSFAGSGLLVYAIGFALKKLLKWMLIIVGFLVGMFFVGVQLLQKYGYISAVNWD